jgi:hypothetical protein
MAKLTESMLRNMIKQELKEALKPLSSSDRIRMNIARQSMDDLDYDLEEVAEQLMSVEELQNKLYPEDTPEIKTQKMNQLFAHAKRNGYTIEGPGGSKPTKQAFMLMAPAYGPDPFFNL